MFVIKKLGLAALALMLLFASAGFTVRAETYPQTLQRRFGELYAPGNQFAVLAFNGELKFAPLLKANVPLNKTDPYNFLTYVGTSGVHSEAEIIAHFDWVAPKYPTITNITLYTRLIPCSNCQPALATWRQLRKDLQAIPAGLYYYQQWSEVSDGDNFDNLVALQKVGWTVGRVCPEGEACPTFQENMRACLFTKPTICKFCDNRNTALGNWVNSVMTQVRSRRSEDWRNAVNNMQWASQAEKNAVMTEVVSCTNRSVGIPVGVPL